MYGTSSKTQEKLLLQELTLQEQQDLKKKQNATLENRIGESTGTDSELVLRESIVLETPEGVCREYTIKPLN